MMMTEKAPAKRVKAADLAGLAEVAKITGVSKRTALAYTRRHDFPQPIARLAAGPVWRGSAVRRWAAARLPLRPGRPPKQG